MSAPALLRPLGTLPPLADEPPRSLWVRYALGLGLPSGLIAFALTLANNRFERGLTADALIPSFVSTVQYTPYFWRQDRYGMLLPYLLQPIGHPLHNLIALSTVEIALALGGLFALAHFFLGRRGPWLVAGLFALCIHLQFSSDHFLYETLGLSQFFLPPLTIGLGALLVQARINHALRLPLAVLLMTLCSWYNFVTPILLGMLVMMRAAFELGAEREVHRRRPWWRARLAAPLMLCLEGALVGRMLRLTASFQQVNLGERQSLGETWESAQLIYQDLLRELALDAGTPRLAWALVGLLGLGLLFNLTFNTTRTGWLRALRPLVVAAPVAVAYAALAASQKWVRESEHNFRFDSPSVMVLLVGLTAWAALPLVRRLRPWQQRLLPLMLCGWAITTTTLRFGAPDANFVRQLLDERGGVLAEAAVTQGASHIAGDYWQVWPTIFAANIRLYEAGLSRRMFAYTARGEEMQKNWPPQRRWRIAIGRHDPQRELCLQIFAQLGLVVVNEDSTLTLLASTLAPADRGHPHAAH